MAKIHCLRPEASGLKARLRTGREITRKELSLGSSGLSCGQITTTSLSRDR